ncbi:DedA family protein [Paenibacillus xanthanilyticus]|uniref:DedA family protein n=1 Tax=Paenibacillus xanthanilyticus TaxID=1783531 RepID=A0ABV8KE78_9BACL
MEWMRQLFEQYGDFVLFGGLFLESLAVPFPGELAMAVGGYMSSLGTMSVFHVMLLSYLGAIIGTTLSYALGAKLGAPFFEKYGKYMLMHPKRINKIRSWMERYGSGVVLISHFIPGFRHFTGYVSGITGFRFRTFLLFNHTGAVAWVAGYVWLGRLLGKRMEDVLHVLEKFGFWALCGMAGLLAAFVLIKRAWQASREKVRQAQDQPGS